MNALSHLNKWATWSEILSQPAIWRHWGQSFDPLDVHDWIMAQNLDAIWLSGAGSSAYIGDISEFALEAAHGPRIRSVPTTDIVSRPQQYLAGRNPLLVNFGRSGNSAETIGVLEAMDALAPLAPCLNITCNGASALAKPPSGQTRHLIVLPAETHDTGFTMIASFTTVLLTALGVLQGRTDFSARLSSLADCFDAILAGFGDNFAPPPERMVFIGTGPLPFAAREAARKVLELSARQIPALWDSTLGFRHGPKAFVTDNTTICIFASQDDAARKYDLDLATEFASQFPAARVTVVGNGGDLDIPTDLGDAWIAPLAVLYAQLLGVFWSDSLGLNVDDPFAGQGTLTRVVSGVTIYPVTP